MSLRYTVENIQKMREAAGLGVLSLGVCAISGELVSSTPIADSRCGHAGQNVADYGGYLLGEGMSQAAALYLANLHNWFPELAKAAVRTVFDLEDGDFLPRVQEIASKHGWNVLEGALDGWIDEHLVDIPAQHAMNGIQVLREQLDETRAQRDQAREEGRKEERERIIRVLLVTPAHRFAYIGSSHPTDKGCAEEFYWFSESIVRGLLQPALSQAVEVDDDSMPF